MGIAACLVAAVLYGVAAIFSRRFLTRVPPLALAAGSQLSAAAVLLVPALWAWPVTPPGSVAWLSAGALAIVCTAMAYVLYFRLIADAGAATAVSVTLLIPAFAMVWGWLFLAERPTAAMLLGCAVVLLGTALSAGFVALPSRAAPAPE